MKMSLWRSAIFRLLLIYGFVFAGSMSGVVYLNYWNSASYTATQADYNIAWQFAYFSALPVNKVPMQIAAHIRSEMRRPINFYGLFTGDHQRITGDILAYPENVRPDGDGIWSKPVLAGQTAVHPEYLRTKAMKLENGDILVVSRDVDEMARLRAYMLGGLVWSAAIVVLGGLAIGILVSSSQLRRVRDVRRVVQQIAMGDFEARLPQAGRDEIAWLSIMVNHMLDEMSRLMHEVKGACDGIAHDLRTPVIHIRSLLARIPAGQLSQAHAPLLEQAREETEDVLQRFAAIMRISEIESIKRKKGFSDVDVDALCRKAADLYQPVAAANGLTFRIDLRARSTIRGDYPLLFEVLANLLDNAIKFTPEGGCVLLSAEEGHDGPTIVVSDSGPGIPDAERSAVFQRFYRSDLTSVVPGSGLGLSIVQAVVRLHDFSLTLSDAHPGLCVRLDCWAQFKRD